MPSLLSATEMCTQVGDDNMTEAFYSASSCYKNASLKAKTTILQASTSASKFGPQLTAGPLRLFNIMDYDSPHALRGLRGGGGAMLPVSGGGGRLTPSMASTLRTPVSGVCPPPSTGVSAIGSRSTVA